MCGITFLVSNEEIKEDMEKKIAELHNLIMYRGPDGTESFIYNKNFYFLFSRLIINGNNTEANQPMFYDNKILMCNGEIYNYKKLAEKYKIELVTGSDCEIIIKLLSYMTFENLLNELEGVFAIVIYDINEDIIYIARDPIGIRPLFYGSSTDNFMFSSEAKTLYNEYIDEYTIRQFPAGSYGILKNNIIYNMEISRYFNLFDKKYNRMLKELSYKGTMNILEKNIKHAVKVRCLVTDMPVGALLSGGIDSSIIALLAKKYLPDLKTFSIGMSSGTDLVPAKIASEAINTNHTEIIFTFEEAIEELENLIRILETHDITTIRASLPMYLLCKYIKNNTDIKVVLSGEGPDEELAGYFYNHLAPSSEDIFEDAIRRVSELPEYDVLRSDRASASNSLEIRVPFLCKHVVRTALNSNPDFRNPKLNDNIEKKILRDIFRNYEVFDKEKWEKVINRPKEAFSDGVGHEWKQKLREYINSKVTDEEFLEKKDLYKTPNKEAYFYRKIYNKYYNTLLVRKYWLPTWGDHGGDPSATVLSVYSDRMKKE
jgi:asparagine synthase (glutamine-hydrolysing)